MAEHDENVVKEVSAEVKALGGNVKKIHKEMQKNYEELKAVVDRSSDDTLDKEKIIKLSDDISVRQEALDKKMTEETTSFTERMDAFEVALKRAPVGSGDPAKAAAEAKDFYQTVLAIQSKDGVGASYGRVKNLDIDMDKFNKYKEAIGTFLRRDEKLISPEEFKALQVGIDPDGGYTVSPAMSAKIIERVYEMDPIRSLCGVESITTGALEIAVDNSESGVGWEEETVAGPETGTPTFAKKRIPVHFMYARQKMTQTLIEDSGINIEAYLAKKNGNKLGRAEAATFVTGNGIGKPRGFLTYDHGTEYGQIEQINSGNATALTADGLIDLKYSFSEEYLNRGTFLMNRTTIASLIKLKDGQGNYLWRPGLLESDPMSSLLGLPVRMGTTMPVVAADALSIVLADFSEAYLIVDRLGITIQRDPYTQKPFVEFYTRKRVGGDVVNYDAIKIQKISA